MSQRLFYTDPDLDRRPLGHLHPDGDYEPDEPGRRPCAEAEANLIGSRCDPDDDTLHMPVIDIDLVPAWLATARLVAAWHWLELHQVDELNLDAIRVVPSSTPGHCHIYLDQVLDWATYADLLGELEDRGVIEPGYYRAAIRRCQTFVRKPGVLKPAAPAEATA